MRDFCLTCATAISLRSHVDAKALRSRVSQNWSCRPHVPATTQILRMKIYTMQVLVATKQFIVHKYLKLRDSHAVESRDLVNAREGVPTRPYHTSFRHPLLLQCRRSMVVPASLLQKYLGHLSSPLCQDLRGRVAVAPHAARHERRLGRQLHRCCPPCIVTLMSPSPSD